jgi:hypothetical protein
VSKGDVDELARRPVIAEVAAEIRREDARIVLVVKEPARVWFRSWRIVM